MSERISRPWFQERTKAPSVQKNLRKEPPARIASMGSAFEVYRKVDQYSSISTEPDGRTNGPRHHETQMRHSGSSSLHRHFGLSNETAGSLLHRRNSDAQLE